MSYKSKYFRNGLWMFSILISISHWSCTKVKTALPQNDEKSTFLYTYKGRDEVNMCIMPADNGYVVVGRDQHQLSKVGYNGETIWDTYVKTTSSVTKNDGLQLSDGSYLINSGQQVSDITRISANGELVYTQRPINSELTQNSPLIEGENGDVYFSYIDYLNNSRFVWVARVDPQNGSLIEKFQYTGVQFDALFPSLSQFHVYRANSNNLWVISELRRYQAHPDGSNNSIYKTCVSKLQTQNFKIEKSVTFTKDDKLLQEQVCTFKATKNNELVLVTAPLSPIFYPNSDNKYFDVRRVDDDLNEIWNTRVEIAASSLQPNSICETQNGNLLIVGTCVVSQSKYITSFAILLDREGHMLRHRIFDENRTFFLWDAIEDKDYFVFAGFSNAFGVGVEGNKRVILKTDKFFNYE